MSASAAQGGHNDLHISTSVPAARTVKNTGIVADTVANVIDALLAYQ